jgi:hypothetical protein
MNEKDTEIEKIVDAILDEMINEDIQAGRAFALISPENSDDMHAGDEILIGGANGNIFKSKILKTQPL